MRFDLQKLRFERMSRKITQDEMATALGLERTSYYKREVGDVKISVEEFSIILKTLDIPQKDAGTFFKQVVPERETI